jgi:hypothetical protein
VRIELGADAIRPPRLIAVRADAGESSFVENPSKCRMIAQRPAVEIVKEEDAEARRLFRWLENVGRLVADYEAAPGSTHAAIIERADS